MRPLDRIDRMILDILQREGRIAISELASRVNLSTKSGDVFDQVARDLVEIPEVLECHLISGEFDYLVKARLKEMSAYRRLLGDLLKKLPASASSHSYVVMEEVKETLYLDVSK